MILAKKLLRIIVPPYQLLHPQVREIEKDMNKYALDLEKQEKDISGWERLLSGHKIDHGSLRNHANRLFEIELRRREILENKASSLLATMGLVVAIVTIVPAVFTKEGTLMQQANVPCWLTFVLCCLFLLAIVYFLLSAYFALKVLKVTYLFLETPEFLKDTGSPLEEESFHMKTIAETLNNTVMNACCTLIKSNNLSVA